MIARCEIDGYELDVSIGEFGKTVVRCRACSRRRSRQCQDCGAPVKGRSWRCEAHKVSKHKQDTAKGERRNREKRRADARRRDRARSPEARARKNAAKKAWREAHPARVMAHKRKGRLRGTWGYRDRAVYLATQKRLNDERREEKRAYMAAKAKYRQPGAVITCRDCGEAFEYQGKGRPRVHCNHCRNHSQVAA